MQDITNSPAKTTAPRKSSFLGKIFGRSGSKSTLDTTTVVAKEEVTPVVAAAPCFYTVVHTFVEGKAEGFWQMLGGMKPEDWAAMAEKHHGLGFHNHSFMPTSPTGVVNCLWECKADTTADDFQAFIDGPDGPGPGIFVNQCYKVMPGAILPTAFFAKEQEAAAPAEAIKSSGSFFWVFHSFKEGKAEGFWQMMGGMKPDDFATLEAKNTALGFANHSFLPCGEQGPCICIWESKLPMSEVDFQKFIDGPDGPGAGEVFDNEVHLAMAGAVLPSAKFTPPPDDTVSICAPCDDTAPADKAFGPAGASAKMWLNKLPDGRQAMRIKVEKGFDWRASVAPILPGCPEWCPATHFGYLESGTMGIRTKEGKEYTIKAGETYLVKPGHLPIMSEDAVMVEFSQDTTYSSVVKK